MQQMQKFQETQDTLCDSACIHPVILLIHVSDFTAQTRHSQPKNPPNRVELLSLSAGNFDRNDSGTCRPYLTQWLHSCIKLNGILLENHK